MGRLGRCGAVRGGVGRSLRGLARGRQVQRGGGLPAQDELELVVLLEVLLHGDGAAKLRVPQGARPPRL